MRAKIYVIAVIMPVILGGMGAMSTAQGTLSWGTVQVTNNNEDDYRPSLYNGTVAWDGRDGTAQNDFEIYYWDGSTIQQITNNLRADTEPSLYNGKIAWQHHDGSDKEIYYWNGSTTQQITNNGAWDADPSLYNAKIAWWGSDGSDMEIYYWNGSTTQPITNTNASEQHPSLYKGKIAWNSADGAPDYDEEIWYWNGSTTQRITNNSTGDRYPSLYNGEIAWEGGGTAAVNCEIHYWDGSTIHQITNNSVHDTAPSLYNGKIAWQGYDGSDYEIYYWDGSTIHQVTNNNTDDISPSLYMNQFGIHIAFVHYDGNDKEIFLTTALIPLMKDITVYPSGNAAVTWESIEGESYDVLYADGLYDEGSLIWSAVTDIVGQAGTTTWEDVNTPSTGARYYKVKDDTSGLYTYDTVGIMWEEVPVGRSLVSTPFIPYDDSLDSVIDDQLTGSTIKFFSDTIEKWDNASSNYLRAWYNTSTGVWEDWTTPGAPPQFGFDEDVGYWITILVFNPPQDICLVGKVSNTDRTIAIAQGRNLCGTAYPMEVTLDDSELLDCGFTGNAINFFSDNIEWWNAGISNYDRVWYDTGAGQWKNWDGTPATKQLVPCEGFWINVLVFNTPFTWICPKPYSEPPND